MAIWFYSTTGEFGCFSNFSRHGFVAGGQRWPTAEHYFQAQKFAGTPHEERIRRASTPKEAKRLGNDRSVLLRRDWESVRDDVMRQAVLRKFETHDDIRALLLGTVEEELIENAPNDYYWGCGADGHGKNRLGQILMEVRALLREREKDNGQ
jgi:ribA/ribD-fused uncharacterized protein